jgi:Family of unknown function (DUF6065)
VGEKLEGYAVTDDFTLKVWRLHPRGCPIVAAEKTLHGTANRGGVRFCGPFTNANKAGWWLFPPVDIDIVWRGGTDFEWELLTPYTDDDFHIIRLLLDELDAAHVHTWLPVGGRTKLTWGLVEEGVVQIWTGCIFETPPGWGLHIRSPVNFPSRACRVMEAVLETDWLQYDVWLNVVFDRRDELVRLRRDEWPPIAQLVPAPRASYDERWAASEAMIDRTSPDADRVFRYFVEYNEKKFAGPGVGRDREARIPAKDSSTYYKERKRLLRPTQSELPRPTEAETP